MKKLLFLCNFFLFLFTITYAQYDSSRVRIPRLSAQEQLLLKSKNQKNTAWALLGSGLAVDALSFAFYPKESESLSSGFGKAILSAGLFVVGTAAIISSIPVFIVSGINRRKAHVIVNAGKVELSPRLSSAEWQLNAGLAFRF